MEIQINELEIEAKAKTDYALELAVVLNKLILDKYIPLADKKRYRLDERQLEKIYDFQKIAVDIIRILKGQFSLPGSMQDVESVLDAASDLVTKFERLIGMVEARCEILQKAA